MKERSKQSEQKKWEDRLKKKEWESVVEVIKERDKEKWEQQ